MVYMGPRYRSEVCACVTVHVYRKSLLLCKPTSENSITLLCFYFIFILCRHLAVLTELLSKRFVVIFLYVGFIKSGPSHISYQFIYFPHTQFCVMLWLHLILLRVSVMYYAMFIMLHYSIELYRC